VVAANFCAAGSRKIPGRFAAKRSSKACVQRLLDAGFQI
jgi:hypothetical protein